MKNYYILLLVLLSHSILRGQNNTPKYYNKIGKVGKIETTNSQVTISKADTVIVKIFISENKTKLFLDGYGEYRDSLGRYIYHFHFINPYSYKYESEITFEYNKPIIATNVLIGNGMFTQEPINGNMGTYFTCNFSSTDGFTIIVGAYEKISVAMKGIVGIK